MTAEQSAQALEPCPFCKSSDLSPATRAQHYVACNNCGGFGPSLGSSHPLMQWDLRRAEIHDAWNTRAQQPSAAQSGWKLVPVEPTEDMFVEGMEADCAGRPSVDDESHVRSIWNRMLEAAPPPPTLEQFKKESNG